MAELVLLLAVRMLRQLTLAEETDLVGANSDISDIAQSLEDSLRNLSADTQMLSDGAREIVDLVYQIVDEIEKFGLLARSSGSGRRSSVILLCFNVLSKGQYGSSIKKKTKSEITSLCTKLDRLLLLGVLPRSADANVESSSHQQWRQKDSAYKVNDDKPVGLVEEKQLILEYLLDRSKVSGHNFEVIPIWGLSGTGKTTLARAIYTDSRVVGKFNKIFQIPASQKFNFKFALLHILEKIDQGSKEKYVDFPVEDLARITRQYLEKYKSLIVIEDICSIDDWQRLRLAVGANGSRILVTTRAREVAENIIQTCYIHEKRPLTEEHSWDLLKRAAFPGKDPEAEIKSSMEKIGRELVKQCEGIPGTIIALAKLLAKKDEKEWEIVQKNARSHLYNVMTPSYDDLSDHLKLCFLYLSHFREDPEIEPEKLSHLWTIEGLISSRECGRMMTLLDLTQEILMILAYKRMIDVEQLVDVKSCRLVGLMGDMCLLKAEERSLLKVIDLRSGDIPPSFSFGTTRRIVIYLGKHSPQFTPELAGKLRSLRIIRANMHQQVEELVFPSIMLELKKFKALRILDFDNIDFRGRKLPVGIFALSLLRYLSFKGCFLDELPSSIRKLTFLQVLDLRIKDSCKIIIPNALQRMGGLQHLYLPPAFQMRNGKKFRLDKLTKLQTLKNFTSNACEICDLFKLTKVRDLHTKIEGSHEDLQSITSHMKVAPEKWLRSSIEIKNFDCYTETRHDVLRQLLALGVPPILSFEGCIGHLPRYNLISGRFTEIFLSSAQLKEDPMTTFEKLPRLRRLVLHDDAFIGTEMLCSALGFPELKHLELSNLFLLEKWTVEDKAMSRLSHLKINNCEKLLLPDGLEFLSTVQEIKTENMPEPFQVSLHKRYGKIFLIN